MTCRLVERNLAPSTNQWGRARGTHCHARGEEQAVSLDAVIPGATSTGRDGEIHDAIHAVSCHYGQTLAKH